MKMNMNMDKIWKNLGRIAALTLFVLIAFCALNTGAAFAAGNGNGYVKCAGSHGGTTFVYSDTVGGTKLAKTSSLQFIYAGTDGVISLPDASGNPTGDDSLITPPGTGTVGTPPTWGDGEFFYFIDGMTDNAKIYVRAWNAASVATATKYGDSSVYTINGGNPKPTPFTWNVPNFATDKNKPVPAPIATVDPKAWGPSAVQGNNPATTVQTITIQNTGTAALTSWSSAAIQYTGGQTGWLTPSKTTGANIAAGASDTFTVTLSNVSAYTAGTYTATVPLSFSQGLAAQNVVVTLTITVLPGTPIITSATPSTEVQGATITSVAIVGVNTHFTAASTVNFGADITSGTVTFTDATHISVSNVVIGASAAAGLRTVTVTTVAENASGQVFTITAAPTQQATTLVIDDYEGACVKPADGYYAFAKNALDNPIEVRDITDKHQGTYAMKTTYTAISNSTDAWRGWGGTLTATKDVSGYDTLSIWVKGDGSTTNKLKVQFKDVNKMNYALQDIDAISLSSNGWAEYRIGGFKSKMKGVTATDTTFDWTKVTEYQVVFSGTDASAGVMVDYVNVTNVAPTTEVAPHIMSITPTNGGEKITVTITGSNFASSGGLINFAGGGTTTSIKTSDTGSLITSWADGQIVLSLPGMSKGVKTVNIVRADNTPSDNSVTFEVTAIATGSGTSYNYPNPFNPLGGEKTIIVFDPGAASNVTVYIFDMTAKQMAKINWSQSEPAAQVIWDGKNIYDEIVGDGVYLYRIVDTGSGKMIGKGKILAVNK